MLLEEAPEGIAPDADLGVKQDPGALEATRTQGDCVRLDETGGAARAAHTHPLDRA